MNLKQILATRPELEKVIYETYPRTKQERRGCEIEKARMYALREQMAKRLIATPSKKEYE